MTKKRLIEEEPAISITEYPQVLFDIKSRIKQAQVRAIWSVNRELINLYWSIGKTIVEMQETHGWGTGLIENLAKDLQNEFPGVSGFSERNIYRMKVFFEVYSSSPQVVAEIGKAHIFNIPWGHNAVLLSNLKDTDQRLWYAQRAIENGWSRSMLEASIKSNLFNREGKAITNFKSTLPAEQSAMAQQSLKDPYSLGFLTLQDGYNERDIEQGLVVHIQKFLLELGKGFAFIGRQVHLEVSEKDYYIDLLFYHTKLHSYIVVELKAGEFDPRDAGQINFYLSAVDDLMRGPQDNPTIGLLLCKSKDNLTAEYALRRSTSPIGIASYEIDILEKLPKELKASLPTVEEIESEFEKQQTIFDLASKKSE